MTPQVLARVEAQRMAAVLRELGVDGAAVGEGWMSADTDGCWTNYAAGLGVTGPVEDDVLDALVAFYAARGLPARVQITNYQHASLLTGLGVRGFALLEAETVLWRGPDRDAVADPRACVVDPDDSAQVTAFVTAHDAGFGGGRTTLSAALTRRVVQHPRTTCWVLEENGAVLASAAVETWQDYSILIAGSTLVDARRRGLQQALIATRLAWVREHGSGVSVIGSVSGGPTERNALRAGFSPSFCAMMLERAS